MIKTPWFPPDAKPVRPGWYECELCHVIDLGCKHYFDGKKWRSTPKDPPFDDQAISWRGLRK